MKKISITAIAVTSALAGGLASNVVSVDHYAGTYGVSIGTDTRYCSIETKLPVFTCEAVVDNKTVRVPIKTMSKVTHQKHHEPPKWFHWQHASNQAAREACGHGPAIIAWGGKGDTSVIICKNGKAENS